MEKSTWTTKVGLAQMLKGGVIMDVVTPEQARIAEDAGAVAVMALERVPADIRKHGGVARMSDPEMIQGIIEAVTIPVMAKARPGVAGARRRLYRRIRGADARRRGQPHQ
jgi:pyridoxal 5'-phosphate synthase pdxS subunit